MQSAYYLFTKGSLPLVHCVVPTHSVGHSSRGDYGDRYI